MNHVTITKILPPTYFHLFIVLSIIIQLIFPAVKFIFYPWSCLGIIPIGFGTLLNIWTDKLFKNKKTTVKPYEKPSKLSIEGPFRISRHPMYLGMFAILFGFAIVLGSIISFIFPLIFAILMEIKYIPFEEEQIEKNFKHEYKTYKKKVRRLIKVISL